MTKEEKEEKPTFSEILQNPIQEAYEDDDFYYIRPKVDYYYDLTMWKVDKRTNTVGAMRYTEFFSIESGTSKINPDTLKKNDYLAHHGRKGQKWGIQNGPPYPLYRQEKFKSKGAYKKVTGTRDRQRQKTSRNKGLVTEAALGIGTTVAVVGVHKALSAAFDKVDEIRFNKHHIDYARREVQRVLQSTDSPMKNGFHTLSKPESVEEAIKNTNPWKDTVAGMQNCVNCSFASCLRMQGYDVVGTPLAVGRDPRKIFKAIKNSKECVHTLKDGRDMGYTEESAARYLKKTVGNEDGNGLISVSWNGGGGGHVFNWEVKNGNVRFFDVQGGKNDINFNDYFSHAARFKTEEYIVRLDNADYDWNKLRKYKVIE